MGYDEDNMNLSTGSRAFQRLEHVPQLLTPTQEVRLVDIHGRTAEMARYMESLWLSEIPRDLALTVWDPPSASRAYLPLGTLLRTIKRGQTLTVCLIICSHIPAWSSSVGRRGFVRVSANRGSLLCLIRQRLFFSRMVERYFG